MCIYICVYDLTKGDRLCMYACMHAWFQVWTCALCKCVYYINVCACLPMCVCLWDGVCTNRQVCVTGYMWVSIQFVCLYVQVCTCMCIIVCDLHVWLVFYAFIFMWLCAYVSLSICVNAYLSESFQSSHIHECNSLCVSICVHFLHICTWDWILNHSHVCVLSMCQWISVTVFECACEAVRLCIYSYMLCFLYQVCA